MSSYFTEITANTAEAAFAEGRMFDVFFDLTLAASESKSYLVELPVDTSIVSYGRSLTILRGDVDFEIFVGSTFSDKGTEISSKGRNRDGQSTNTPKLKFYEDPVITTSGLLTEVDRASQPGFESVGSVVSRQFPARFPKGVFLELKITNTSGIADVRVLYRGFWEEY